MHSADICSGDLVQVELDVEVFRMMQEGHGGWNDDMAKVDKNIVYMSHQMHILNVTYFLLKVVWKNWICSSYTGFW